jgi:hypothetical protein
MKKYEKIHIMLSQGLKYRAMQNNDIIFEATNYCAAIANL